jgi:hypothetical protein
MMTFKYRVTKYDPRKRDNEGRYLAEEWTRYSEIGQVIAGRALTVEEYTRIETAYIKAAMNFIAECDVAALTIRGLENSAGHRPDSFELSEGTRISGDSLYEALRGLLREEFWCRLEGEHGSYIHVGWDYYLYVGVPCEPSASIEAAQADGLFVELFESPYKSH